jgi:hypothetical protein
MTVPSTVPTSDFASEVARAEELVAVAAGDQLFVDPAATKKQQVLQHTLQRCWIIEPHSCRHGRRRALASPR